MSAESRRDINELLDTLNKHGVTNRETACAVHQLIVAMQEQHEDMRAQHRDLQEQHADNDANNRTMMWATVVMTLATVVMAFEAVTK